METDAQLVNLSFDETDLNADAKIHETRLI